MAKFKSESGWGLNENSFDLAGIEESIGTHTSKRFSATVGTGRDAVTYKFTGTNLGDYDAKHRPHSGTITGITITRINSINSQIEDLKITGLSLDAAKFYKLLHHHDQSGFLAALTSGDDNIDGVAMDGGKGNDTFQSTYGATGGSGNDTFILHRRTRSSSS
jgi:hypothetical protein